MIKTTLCYIEKDETPDQCLLREVYEETGLKLISYQSILYRRQIREDIL